MSRFNEIVEEVRGLDPRNPGSWPTYAKRAAAVGLALAIVGLSFHFLVKPENERLAQLQGQEVGLRAEYEKKAERAANLDAYREQLAEMERSFGAMLKQLPSKSEVANLLNDISQTRIASSLTEELFKPTGEVPKEFYAELPNDIVVVGGYHQMGEFVSGISSLPRIVTIENVEIKPAQAAARGRGRQAAVISDGDLRMTATIKTYRYLDDEEIAAQESARLAEQRAARGRRR